MYMSLFLALLSLSNLRKVNADKTGCQTFLMPNDDNNMHVTCKGNFSELESLRRHLQDITGSIRIFQLKDAGLEVLPPDLFHHISKPDVRKVIFDNVTLELLGIPELGDPPLKSIKDTVESMEIYYSSAVFAWDFPSLSFRNLKNIIIEDSELISITVPFFFWPELRFIQIQNSSLRWIHDKAFQGNKKLAICSLAYNRITEISRKMFPSPAAKLYSLDLSFNRLKSLPSDMFSKMDMLHELKLDNNRLKYVFINHLRPVWNNLTQLWLDDNDVRCASLCWIAEQTERPMFLESSKCKFTGRFMLIKMYLDKCIS